MYKNKIILNKTTAKIMILQLRFKFIKRQRLSNIQGQTIPQYNSAVRQTSFTIISAGLCDHLDEKDKTVLF